MHVVGDAPLQRDDDDDDDDDDVNNDATAAAPRRRASREFSVEQCPALPHVVAARSFVRLSVTYAPNNVGQHTATLNFTLRPDRSLSGSKRVSRQTVVLRGACTAPHDSDALTLALLDGLRRIDQRLTAIEARLAAAPTRQASRAASQSSSSSFAVDNVVEGVHRANNYDDRVDDDGGDDDNDDNDNDDDDDDGDVNNDDAAVAGENSDGRLRLDDLSLNQCEFIFSYVGVGSNEIDEFYFFLFILFSANRPQTPPQTLAVSWQR